MGKERASNIVSRCFELVFCFGYLQINANLETFWHDLDCIASLMSIALCEAMLYSHAAQPSTYLSYHSNVEVKSYQTHYTHIDHVKKHQTRQTHQRRQLYELA